jgi:hypothetical protein
VHAKSWLCMLRYLAKLLTDIAVPIPGAPGDVSWHTDKSECILEACVLIFRLLVWSCTTQGVFGSAHFHESAMSRRQ